MKTKTASRTGEQAKSPRKTESEAPQLAWSVRDSAHRLGIGRSTIYKLATEGKLRLVKVAGRTLILDTEIARLLTEGAQ
jgi:excisionase family DNA binding protein